MISKSKSSILHHPLNPEQLPQEQDCREEFRGPATPMPAGRDTAPPCKTPTLPQPKGSHLGSPQPAGAYRGGQAGSGTRCRGLHSAEHRPSAVRLSLHAGALPQLPLSLSPQERRRRRKGRGGERGSSFPSPATHPT